MSYEDIQNPVELIAAAEELETQAAELRARAFSLDGMPPKIANAARAAANGIYLGSQDYLGALWGVLAALLPGEVYRALKDSGDEGLRVMAGGWE